VTDTPTISVRSGDEDGRTRITFGNGDSEELLLTPVGEDLYRLEESSLLGEAMYRDVIKAKLLDDGGLQFLHIEARSGLTVQSWLVSEDMIAASDFQAILSDVMAVGGNWEQAFGGLLLIHTPPDNATEFFARVQGCTDKRS
jgi:hypothetical protein